MDVVNDNASSTADRLRLVDCLKRDKRPTTISAMRADWAPR